ncbi:MAG: hypothetical protein ACR2PL_03920, partial [Dehalococcoidia bacterium]
VLRAAALRLMGENRKASNQERQVRHWASGQHIGFSGDVKEAQAILRYRTPEGGFPRTQISWPA